MLSNRSTQIAPPVSAALTEGPPTPEVPVVPLPATVTSTPFCPTKAGANERVITIASLCMGIPRQWSTEYIRRVFSPTVSQRLTVQLGGHRQSRSTPSQIDA